MDTTAAPAAASSSLGENKKITRKLSRQFVSAMRLIKSRIKTSGKRIKAMDQLNITRKQNVAFTLPEIKLVDSSQTNPIDGQDQEVVGDDSYSCVDESSTENFSDLDYEEIEISSSDDEYWEERTVDSDDDSWSEEEIVE